MQELGLGANWTGWEEKKEKPVSNYKAGSLKHGADSDGLDRSREREGRTWKCRRKVTISWTPWCSSSWATATGYSWKVNVDPFQRKDF